MYNSLYDHVTIDLYKTVFRYNTKPVFNIYYQILPSISVTVTIWELTLTFLRNCYVDAKQNSQIFT
jgi:hypothetical protein